MATEVLIITGVSGVGKTTMAKAWAKEKKGAIIETDYFTEWVFDPNFPHWSDEEEEFTARLSVLVALEYLKIGLSVAIENVWSPLGIGIMQHLFQVEGIERHKVTFVWLSCSLDENMYRDLERPEENQMGERVGVLHNLFQHYKWQEFVHRIDTSQLSISETLTRILSYSQGNQS